jgi:hypothetical protein
MQLFGLMEDARSVPRFSAGSSSGRHGLRSSDGRLVGTTARSPTLSQFADTRGRTPGLAVAYGFASFGNPLICSKVLGKSLELLGKALDIPLN